MNIRTVRAKYLAVIIVCCPLLDTALCPRNTPPLPLPYSLLFLESFLCLLGGGVCINKLCKKNQFGKVGGGGGFQSPVCTNGYVTDWGLVLT